VAAGKWKVEDRDLADQIPDLAVLERQIKNAASSPSVTPKLAQRTMIRGDGD
jgi:hypothetical protein